MLNLLKKVEYIGGFLTLFMYLGCLVFCTLMKFEIIEVEALNYINWDMGFNYLLAGGAVVLVLFRRMKRMKPRQIVEKPQREKIKLPDKEEILKKAKLNAEKFQKKE